MPAKRRELVFSRRTRHARGQSARGRALSIEALEFRRVLATGWITGPESMLDFEASNASQFGGGQAIFGDEKFLGVESFDTGKFEVDAFWDEVDAGAKADIRLFGKAGLNLGYYANAGSINLKYDDVQLSTDYQDANSLVDSVIIDPNVDFSNSNQNAFSTMSPTLGAYVDLVLQAKTEGELTAKLPWPLSDIGGTVSLDQTIIDINQELLSFNRDGSNQLRLLGEDVLAGGVEINVPVAAVPPTSISLAAAQLKDEQGDPLLGVDAAASLTVANLGSTIVPSKNKSVDNASQSTLKTRARQIANSPLSTELATMQLNVPRVNLQSTPMNVAGVMTANNLGQQQRENLIAALNLNLGLKDLTFSIDPATISITPFNFQLSPSLYATQEITVTPVNRITYHFDHRVSGKVLSDSGALVRSFNATTVKIDESEKLQIDFLGRPIQVESEWTFEAQVNNTIYINAFLDGKLTILDLAVDANIDQWIKDFIGLPFDPGPLYENSVFSNPALASFEIPVDPFSVINDRVSLDSFEIGGDVQGSLGVDTFTDEIANNGNNSLREAIVYANAQATTDEQVIYLDSGTYGLSLPGTGAGGKDLDVSANNLRIVGQGAGATIIDANSIDRVFEVAPGAKLTLEALTVTGGRTSHTPGVEVTRVGGGIAALGELHLIDVDVKDNRATDGAGVYALGGGSMVRSNVSLNTAISRGGGMFVADTAFSIHSSTLNANLATGRGGAIYNSERVTLTSSTVSMNRSFNAQGVAIFSDRADVHLFGSTISANRREAGGLSTAVYMDGSLFTPGGKLLLNYSIIAGNENVDVGPHGLFGLPANFAIDDQNKKSLVGETGITTWSTAVLHGAIGAPIDPELSFLSGFGGRTQVHVPMPGSPAIGGGSWIYPDQRGLSVLEGTRDIGATEFFTSVTIGPNTLDELPDILNHFVGQGGVGTINLVGGTYKVVEEGDTRRAMDVWSVNPNGLNLTIQGAGQDNTTLDAFGYREGFLTVSGNGTLTIRDLSIENSSSDFHAGALSNTGVLNLHRVTLRNNQAVDTGGALYLQGDTTITDSLIEGNSASHGGAIRVNTSPGENVRIERTEIRNNRANSAVFAPQGGGIYISQGQVEIVDSVLSGNMVGTLTTSASASGKSAYGGGISVTADGELLLDRSTLLDNAAVGQGSATLGGGLGFGGGLFSSGDVTIIDSTFSGNLARGGNSLSGNAGHGIGGAIFVASSGRTTIESSTLVGNLAEGGLSDSGTDGQAIAGGIWESQTTAPSIKSSVIADNGAGNNNASYSQFEKKDVAGVFDSQGFNFVGVSTSTAGFNQPTDQTGQVTDLNPPIGTDLSSYSLNPMLTDVDDHGGPTPTLLPLLGSQLIDAGSASSTSDQRGMPRPIGPQDDIGAVELQTVYVDTTLDDLNRRSLRRAMIDANLLSTGGQTIDIYLPAGTYVLDRQGSDNNNQRGSLDVANNKKIRIIGSGAGDTIIDASNVADKAFDVSTGGELTLHGLTVIGSEVNPYGHAARTVANFGTLKIRDAHLTGARTGAAIRNGSSGVLDIERTSFTDNHNDAGPGGAILNDGQLTIQTTTFAGNQAGTGAAISHRGGSATLERVTIAENSASGGTGGIDVTGGSLSLRQSILAQNTGVTPNLSGTVQSLGNNLVGQVASSTGFVASDVLHADPRLAALQAFAPLPFFPLELTSQALDTGVDTGIVYDQNGNPTDLGNGPDIGAIEHLALHVTNSGDQMLPGSLRYAVDIANHRPGRDSITFDDALNSAIVLDGAPLTIEDSLDLIGNSSLQTVIDGDARSRVIDILPHVEIVSLDRVTIRNGNTSGNGGGIRLGGPDTQVVITDSQLVDNVASGMGGGIYAPGGTIALDGATITSNSAAQGGGVFIAAGTGLSQAEFSSINSTFSENTAAQTGGAILFDRTSVTLDHTTIANNHATGNAGGIEQGADSAMMVHNSIVAGNTTGGAASDMSIASGADTQVGNTLIGDNAGTSLAEAPANSPDAQGNIVGSSVGGGKIDPLLGDLQDNGGATPTLAPAFTSPAVGAADSAATAMPEDQRGLKRDLAAPDMGAIEIQKVQNIATANTSSVVVLPISGDRIKVSYLHEGAPYSEITSTPLEKINVLPRATAIGPQTMREDSVLRIPFQISDFELGMTNSLDLIQISASSNNEAILPNANIQLSGTGSQRFVTLTPAPEAFTTTEPVIVTLTLDDGDGSNDFYFTVKIIEEFDVTLPSGTSNNIRIQLNGTQVEVLDLNASSALLASAPVVSTNSLRIHGDDTSSDTIEFDYATGGFFSFPGGIDIDGGVSANDTLTVTGTGNTAGSYSTDMAPVGQPELELTDPAGNGTIRYRGFEHLNWMSLDTLALNDTLSIGGGSLRLDVQSDVTLPGLTLLSGGTLSSSSPLVLASGNQVTANGVIAADFQGLVGSSVALTGDLDFGSSLAAIEFDASGSIDLGKHTLSIFDANQASIGGSIHSSLSTTSGKIVASQDLHVGGSGAALLEVDVDGAAPQVGDSFHLLIAGGQLNQDFDTITLPSPPHGSGWHLNDQADELTLDLLTLAQVHGVTIGNGSSTSQRSQITQLEIEFDGEVDIDSDAFEFTKRGPGGGAVATTFTTSTNQQGNTVATLEFSGTFTRGALNALVDGNYQLNTNAAKVRRAGTDLTLDGDDDGVAGGGYALGTLESDWLYALYGDANGNGNVDFDDFSAFGAAFNQADEVFDFNGNSIVDFEDFSAFGSNFNKNRNFQ